MKTAVITGTGRGIGLATAKKFLAEGWRVIGTYYKTPTAITSPDFTSLPYDQSSPESIAHFAKEIAGIAPQIDILINNAGTIFDNHSFGADVKTIRATLEVDLLGVIDITEKLLPFIPAGGHIVNIDSDCGSFSMPIDDETSVGYRISKAALNMYTRTLAFELRVKGIIVSSIDPGWVKTDMGNAVASETEGPDREPEAAAQDIYNVVTNVVESGCFWKFGKKREW
jgi:NAD(P)-dependent dehydrogenase (short-subunit alcohol dehydrogenase family)